MTLVPILDDNLFIIGTVEFEGNLTISNAPDYVNENGEIGLKRLDQSYGKHWKEIVYMFYDRNNPKTSYAEIITPKEAYVYCLNRGKLDLASKLGLKFIEGDVEVI